jgi:integration host factor subunit beta
MKRIDLIESVASQIDDLNRSKAKTATDIIFDKITSSIVDGDGVEIRGFGSFTKKDKAARVGINPRTGDKTQVPAKSSVFFKPGKNLKQQVNNL